MLILPDFILPSRVNQSWDYSGIDSLEYCKDQNHFLSYPYPVSYDYNSRGFRDSEWPSTFTELTNSIWCVGDSFTVGIGSSLEHTWPQLLQEVGQQKTINVSMDGASNNWIARKCLQIIKTIQPKYLVVQWSYVSRREKDLKDKISDEDLRLYSINCSPEQDMENTLNCIHSLYQSENSTTVIHSFVPNFSLIPYDKILKSKIPGRIVEFEQVDLARDGHHYDIKTASDFVQKVVQLLP
jgi:hypothetical protein